MYYLTMEFVEGTSLEAADPEPRPAARSRCTLTVGKQLCRALEVAHEQGVIHRDIKPQNIVVEPNGFLKVMDFGIARLANPPKGKGLTEAGMAIGTPDYMSPEQLSGLELDPRSDLYSAGVVLFECLTGRLPFEADTPWSLIAKHIEEEPPDPRTRQPRSARVAGAGGAQAMAKDRERRYPDGGGDARCAGGDRLGVGLDRIGRLTHRRSGPKSEGSGFLSDPLCCSRPSRPLSSLDRSPIRP